MAPKQLFTIGHSTRSFREFCDLLSENSIRLVVDVRKLPGSTRHPQFNEDVLAEALHAHDIELLRLEALTGRRPVSKSVPFDVNAWWQNRSFHNYADHALSAEFREDLATLLRWASERPTTVMCSEAVWWRCHRRIIADHAIAAEASVTHILGENKLTLATLSKGAQVDFEHQVTYPKESNQTAD